MDLGKPLWPGYGAQVAKKPEADRNKAIKRDVKHEQRIAGELAGLRLPLCKQRVVG
jgi:hypothetical protein